MSSFHNFSDEQLIAMLKVTKNHQSFSELVTRHEPQLYAFLYRFTNDKTETEDLIQETFIKCYDKIHSFSHRSQFKTWLFSIGYREFLQYKRKSQSFKKLINKIKQSFVEKEQTVIQENIDLIKALNQLNHYQKAAIILCDACGMSHTEAAKTMDLPLGSIKTYIQQARKQMKNNLGESDEK